MSLHEPRLSHIRLKQTKRYRHLRRLRHFVEGFSALDFGLWRRFEQPPIVAVDRDFAVIGMELRRQMVFFRDLHPGHELPKPVTEPEQLRLLSLPLRGMGRSVGSPAVNPERRVHAR